MNAAYVLPSADDCPVQLRWLFSSEHCETGPDVKDDTISELFRQIVRTRRHTYEVVDAKGQRRTVVWNNTNRLLDMEGYDGIKTGTTSAAGACLVASGRRGTDHLYVVVLGSTSSDGRYVDARNLFRWAWRERGHRE